MIAIVLHSYRWFESTIKWTFCVILTDAPPMLVYGQKLIGQLAMIGSWRNAGWVPAECIEAELPHSLTLSLSLSLCGPLRPLLTHWPTLDPLYVLCQRFSLPADYVRVTSDSRGRQPLREQCMNVVVVIISIVCYLRICLCLTTAPAAAESDARIRPDNDRLCPDTGDGI